MDTVDRHDPCDSAVRWLYLSDLSKPSASRYRVEVHGPIIKRYDDKVAPLVQQCHPLRFEREELRHGEAFRLPKLHTIRVVACIDKHLSAL